MDNGDSIKLHHRHANTTLSLANLPIDLIHPYDQQRVHEMDYKSAHLCFFLHRMDEVLKIESLTRKLISVETYVATPEIIAPQNPLRIL
jgi:hypothetical protein